ncbi:MAG: superinfection immunity protein [Alphaproteobacteria bacterium]
MRSIAAVAFGLIVAAFGALSLSGGESAEGWQAELAAWLFAGAAIFDLSAGFLAYFAPLWIALLRHHPDAVGIATFNLLLGWTVIGWLLAMVWALSSVPERRGAVRIAALRR